MNWDAAGAIGEMIGAAGVVLSLVYLAVQIRQGSAQTRLNTKAIHATAFQSLVEHQLTEGLITEDQWSTLYPSIVREARRKAFGGWWAMAQSGFPAPFAGIVDEILVNPDARSEEAPVNAG